MSLVREEEGRGERAGGHRRVRGGVSRWGLLRRRVARKCLRAAPRSEASGEEKVERREVEGGGDGGG